MASLVKTTPHPHKRTGYHLTFSNGHKWSLVDLSDFSYKGEPTPDPRNKVLRDASRSIASMYDAMGGHFEAMCFNSKQDYDLQLRAMSYEKLVIEVLAFEFDADDLPISNYHKGGR